MLKEIFSRKISVVLTFLDGDVFSLGQLVDFDGATIDVSPKRGTSILHWREKVFVLIFYRIHET